METKQQSKTYKTTPKSDTQHVVAPLKTYNIFYIDKTTILATKVRIDKVRELMKEFPNLATDIDKGEYFIYRWEKVLSKTSKITINRINEDVLIENKIISIAFNNLKNYLKNSTVSDNFFEIFSKKVFNDSLKETTEPDDIIEKINSIMGVNLADANDEQKAVYHIYEALVRKNSNDKWGGYDKVQHFIHSAYLQYFKGPNNTDLTQYIAEIWDLIGGDPLEESKNDMYANNRGQKYGASLYSKYHPVRSWIFNNDNP